MYLPPNRACPGGLRPFFVKKVSKLRGVFRQDEQAGAQGARAFSQCIRAPGSLFHRAAAFSGALSPPFLCVFCNSIVCFA